MSWCAVDVRSREADRAAIASWLVGRSGQAVEERDDGTLVSFSETEAAAREVLLELRHAFAGVEGSTRGTGANPGANQVQGEHPGKDPAQESRRALSKALRGLDPARLPAALSGK